ncbi:MAG: hypothetical protein L0322_26215 [Chloroflexi bacterium]|nr:hypothetical protein [Chloroflexota bacterium]
MLWALVVVALLAAIGGLALAGLAFRQRQQAQANFAHSESQRLAAEANGLLQSGRSPELAALLAIQALAVNPTHQADLALQRASRFYYGERVLAAPVGLQSVTFSPDGRLVAAGGNDGSVRVWAVDGGELLAEWPAGEGQPIYGLAFSPDGQYLLTSGDNLAQLWAAQAWPETGGKALFRFEELGGAIYSAAFSPDGRYALTAGGQAARLWSVAAGREAARFAPAGDVVTIARFAPDNRHVAVGGYNGLVYLWDSQTDAVIQTYSGHSDIIDSLAFSPDGRLLVTSAEDNTARLWDVATGETWHVLANHSDLAYSVAFAPDGKMVLTGSWDTTARLWDVATGEEAAVLRGHAAAVYQVALSPDGRLAATASQDGTVRLWDVTAAAPPDTLAGHEDWINGAAFSPDGRLAATASDDGTVRLWDVAGQQLLQTLAHDNQAISVGFTPDGRGVWSSSRDGTTRLWDVASGAELQRYPLGGAASLSPDGRFLLVSHLADQTAYLLDAATGEPVAGFAQLPGVLLINAYAPDGETVLLGTAGGAVQLAVSSGQEVRRFEHPDLAGVAVSPDGRYVLTAGQNGSAILWSAGSGEIVQRLAGHSARIWAAAFSPDGQHVLTAGEDGLARLWAVADGQELRRLTIDGGAIGAVAFAPDRPLLLLGGAAGAAVLTPQAYPDLIAAVCGRVLRELAAGERALYGIEGEGGCP